MRNNPEDDGKELYQYLRTQFKDLESAHIWYGKWCDEMGQEIEGHGMFSLRTMAHHVSNVLEGLQEPEEDQYWKPYYNTKYGSEIYFRSPSEERETKEE